MSSLPVQPVKVDPALLGNDGRLSSEAVRRKIEGALADRWGGVLSPREKQRPEMLLIGIAELDALTGGLPRGCLSELCGPASSGRTSVMVSALAQATQRGELCALVDASDSFDPIMAEAAGVVLDRLLWVRCSAKSKDFSMSRSIDMANGKTADQRSESFHHSIAQSRESQSTDRHITKSADRPIKGIRQIEKDTHTRNVGWERGLLSKALESADEQTTDTISVHAMFGIRDPRDPETLEAKRTHYTHMLDKVAINMSSGMKGCGGNPGPKVPLSQCAEPVRASSNRPDSEAANTTPTTNTRSHESRTKMRRSPHPPITHSPDLSIDQSAHRDIDKSRNRRRLTSFSRIEQALKAVDLLLQSGGFGMVIVDMGDLVAEQVAKVPLTSWFRFRRAVEKTPTVLLVLEREPHARSCASLVVNMQSLRTKFTRVAEGAVCVLYEGMRVCAEIVRGDVLDAPAGLRKKAARAEIELGT